MRLRDDQRKIREVTGSRPEQMDIPGTQWMAKNYTEREWDTKGGQDGKGGPKKKVGLPDQREISQAYRDGWDRIFGKKES